MRHNHRVFLFPVLVIWFSASAFFAHGQTLNFGQPEKLSEAINSDSEESYPLLTPDGRTLYFTRIFSEQNTGGKHAGSDIWISRLDEDGAWQAATQLPDPLNNKHNNIAIGISKSGDRIYLLNTYKSVKKSDVALIDTRFSDRKPEVSSIPKIGIEDGFLGLYMHPSEKILMISMAGPGSYGKEDLYVMLKDSTGAWSDPMHLGPNINTEGYEISPFLSEDGNRLYFASNGHGGYGDADIFVSQRLYNTWNVWTRPVNLGANINSPGFDAYFVLADDKALFVSNREGNFSDIYKSDLVPSEIDSTNLQIQRLIEDAKKLLQDDNGGNNTAN